VSPYDIAGFVTGLINVWFTVRNDVWNWPWGIVNSAVFLVSFWTAGLFADSALQIVYIVLGAYGWWAWLHGRNAAALPISHLTRNGGLLAGAALLVMTAVFARVLANALGSTVPLWDGITTALSLVAQVLLTRRIIENWWFWLAADAIYIPLYFSKHLPLTSVLYVVFFGLCIAGLAQWRRELGAAAAPA
jgi:nicotinamide mononucleotide transporter